MDRGSCLDACNRCRKDDPAAPLFAHWDSDLLSKKKASLEVGSQKPIPIRRRPIGQRHTMINACIGHQNVQATIARDDDFDGTLAGLLVGHIEGRDFGRQATTAQSARGGIKRINTAAVEYNDCASLSE